MRNSGDQATQLSADQLIKPLAQAVALDKPDWSVEALTQEEAIKARLGPLLGGSETPALLFTASHGMGFPNGDRRQLRHQGALLCQDWPGPVQWRQPIPEDFYFNADDIGDAARLLGLITFHFACYGAGTLASVAGAIGSPGLDELCARLTDRSRQYTLLHVVCHGKVIEGGETVVYWANANNRTEPVKATELLERLGRVCGPRGLPHFAFLSTCESASAEAEGALGGLAQRLVRELGMPAVLAMTEKVTMTTAAALATAFYRQLGQSGEVDTALPEATAALARRGDILVPVLFSRLGGRPLFSDQLDRELTNEEIKRIVTASYDKTARLWDAETGKPIGELTDHKDAVYSAAFSPDGKRIVTASFDDTARLWDAETGKPIGEPLKGHESYVTSAAFSPDGKRIVTASWDTTARLWDAETGKPIGELTGHKGPVSSAEFSPDGKRIVTASWDTTARLWDAETGKPIGELTGHKGAARSAAFSPDGKRIVTASLDKTARLWEIFANTQALVSHAKAATPRCLTVAQRTTFFLAAEPPRWCIELEKWPYHTQAWKQGLSDTRAGKNTPLATTP